MVDLTAVATPGYFASKGIENQLLKKRAGAHRPHGCGLRAGRDTLANLTMEWPACSSPWPPTPCSTGSRLSARRPARAWIAVAATAAVATTVADRIIRKRAAQRRASPGAPTTAQWLTNLVHRSSVGAKRPPSACANGHGSTNGHGPRPGGDGRADLPTRS